MGSSIVAVARRIAAATAGILAISFGGAAAAQTEAPTASANLYVGLAVGQSDAEDLCAGLAGCDIRSNVWELLVVGSSACAPSGKPIPASAAGRCSPRATSTS